MSDRPYVLRPVARAAIHRARNRLSQSPSDRADLDQELTLRLLHGLRQYQPSRGPVEPFVVAVVDRAAAMIARERNARKRAARTLPLSALAWEPSCRSVNEDAVTLALDVAEALRQLPTPDRNLAMQLMQQSVSEVARTLGVRRSTLQRRVAKLRSQMEMLGISADSYKSCVIPHCHRKVI